MKQTVNMIEMRPSGELYLVVKMLSDIRSMTFAECHLVELEENVYKVKYNREDMTLCLSCYFCKKKIKSSIASLNIVKKTTYNWIPIRCLSCQPNIVEGLIGI